MDLAVRRLRRAPHQQGVERPGRGRRWSRTSRRPPWCRGRRRRPWPARREKAPSTGSAYALMSEPASPKSRANASGSTTRSVSPGSRSPAAPGWRRDRDRRRAGRGRSGGGRSGPPSKGATGGTLRRHGPPRLRRSRARRRASGPDGRRRQGGGRVPRPHPARARGRRARRRLPRSSWSATRCRPRRPVTFVRENPPYGGPVAALLTGRDALLETPTTLGLLAVDMPRVGRTDLRTAARGRARPRRRLPHRRRRSAPAGGRGPDSTGSTRPVPTLTRQDGMPLHRLLGPLDLVEVAPGGRRGPRRGHLGGPARPVTPRDLRTPAPPASL